MIVLRAILSEWSSNTSYAQRVDSLLNGTGSILNGIKLARGSTVTSDSDRDKLFGGLDLDLFFAGLGDFTDHDPLESKL